MLCCLWGYVTTHRWSVPSLTRRRVSLGCDWLGCAEALPSGGPLDCTYPSVPGVSFRCIYVLLVGCCFFRVWGFPPPVNVNRAYQDRLHMPIWSFYSKTYIVILTCPSDMFPPVLPTFACHCIRLRIEVQVWMEATLPGISARRT